LHAWLRGARAFEAYQSVVEALELAQGAAEIGLAEVGGSNVENWLRSMRNHPGTASRESFDFGGDCRIASSTVVTRCRA